MWKTLKLLACLLPSLLTARLIAQGVEPPAEETWTAQNRSVMIATTRPALRSAELQRVIPRVLFKETRFEDAIGFLQQHTETNLRVRWGYLAPEGITKDLPVSLQLLNVTVEQALRELLEDAGGSLRPLGYRLENNIVVITRADLLPSQPIARVYDIRDLMLAALRFAETFPKDDPASRPQPKPINFPLMPQIGKCTELDIAGSLSDYLTETIEPDNWVQNGGKFASVHYFAGHLTVVQNETNHAKIEKWLQVLRQSLRTPPATDR